MEKYEEKLWGKVDFLHEKTINEQNKMNIFSDIIIKYQTALVNFSKSIESIKALNTEIISEKDNSISIALQNLKKVLNMHITEFKECSIHMKRTIIEPIIKTKDEKYSEEKEMYTQYNKLKNLYSTLKSNSDKAKKEFDNNAKFCENNIHNLIQYKSNTLSANNENDIEIIKGEEKMKSSLLSTKTLEEKYIKSLDEVNNTREKMIKKEDELLKFYQKVNYDFYNKISCAIIYMIPILKNLFHSLLLELSATEERCKKMNILEDINNFIINNSTNLSPEKTVEFEPYYPQADLTYTNISGKDKKELENLDINYQIIEILKNNFKDIRTDINMKREQKKYRLRFLCNEIFKIGPGVGFTSEEKEELINLIKKPRYKSFFLIILSKQRTKGRFKRSEKLIKDLVEIIINILDSSEIENDFESAKNCIVLSETFYYEKDENKKVKDGKKIFLIDFIKYYKWFQDLNFWEGIIENMIQKEILKNEKINIKNKTIETDEEIKAKISNFGFSIVLSYTNTMIEFNISKEDINKIVQIFVEKYNIDENIAKTIYENVEATPLPETSEENKKIFEEMFDLFVQKKNSIEENVEMQIEENNLENGENVKVEENKIENEENNEENNVENNIQNEENNIENGENNMENEENNKVIEENNSGENNNFLNNISIKDSMILGINVGNENDLNQNEEIKENEEMEEEQDNIEENEIKEENNN